ncbi:MAG: pilus assembly protein [Vampirovibrio sp.]|nr:pilus assembly protein [Vampirovibrio sp.]
MRNKRSHKSKGQNLVELTMVFPFLLIMILGTIELGRLWQTFEAAKMAATDGAYTATIFQGNTAAKIAAGTNQIQTRANSANLDLTNSQIQTVNASPSSATPIGFQASITVNYTPLMGGLSIPSMSGPLTIIPNGFPISYQNVSYYSVY